MPRLIKAKFLSFIASHIIAYPTPINLNFLWSFGSLLGLGLVVQVITGIFLAMHYTPHMEYAFLSIEHIMRDVQYGYILRYAHSNGASMLFLLIYLHIFRGIFYGSFVNNLLVWWSGLVLFLLMMGTAFLGYVLPWGQMSLWGATVITNLASAIPFVGSSIVQWLWGGFSVDNATLNRFFSLHYCLPFIILGLIVLHLAFLHSAGSSNPLGVTTKGSKIGFYPFFYVKDLFAFLIYLVIFSTFVFFFPNVLGHPDNYIMANPMVTPAHIVPEWYFLPFYAILRAFPNKVVGVIAMLAAIIILAFFPVVKPNNFKSAYFKPLYQGLFWSFVAIFILLGWLGQKSAVAPYVLGSLLAAHLYFFILIGMIFVLPLLDYLLLQVSKHPVYCNYLK